MMRAALTALAIALAACGAPADPAAPSAPAAAQPGAGVQIADPWARPTPGGAQVAAGYLAVANHGAVGDRLIGAASPRAGRVELHSMTMNAGVMEMRKLEALDIPAGAVTALAPGGLHLMFFELTAPFMAGETVPVTLRFEHAGTVETVLAVRREAPAGQGGDPAHAGH